MSTARAPESLLAFRKDRRGRAAITQVGDDRSECQPEPVRLIVASLVISRWPDSVAYDPSLQRIYCAGGLGTLKVVLQEDADVYCMLEHVSTPFCPNSESKEFRQPRVEATPVPQRSSDSDIPP